MGGCKVDGVAGDEHGLYMWGLGWVGMGQVGWDVGFGCGM